MLVAQVIVFVALQATLEPTSLPASGTQLATLRLDQPGMVHLSARSDSGTACELVDHLRGPFARSGESGRENCGLDLFLDAGVYRIRLHSPARGRGQVDLQVRPFEELNPTPRALAPGGVDERSLAPGQQVSYWLRQVERGPVLLRARGRTAGRVALWRDGQWLEELQAENAGGELGPGRPVHAWILRGTLEPGDYRLTVYGAEPRRFTEGEEGDELQVAHGFPPAPAERALPFVLPATGSLALELPVEAVAAFLALDRAPGSPVSLSVWSLGAERLQSFDSRGACSIPPRALVPACQIRSRLKQGHALVVEGPAGTSGLLRWAGALDGRRLADDLYGEARAQLDFEAPAAGEYLVAADDVPLDPDAPPLGCLLESRERVRYPLLEADFLALDKGRRFERAFNHDGNASSVWFELGAAAVLDLRAGGELEAGCELYRFEGQERKRLASSEDTRGKRCELKVPLGPGRYELRLLGGRSGIEKLTLAPVEASGALLGLGALVGQAGLTTKDSCRFERVRLEQGGQYRLVFSRVGRVGARGLHLRKLPLDLARPLPLTLDAGESLRLPLSLRSALEVRAVGGAAFACALASGPRSEARDGLCRLPAPAGPDELVLEQRGGESIGLLVMRAPVPVGRAPLPGHDPRARALPGLRPGQALNFDFERGQSHSALLEVDRPGLYRVTTEGLLATECRVRTPVFTSLFADRGSGRGRNCLVMTYLRPGRYLLTATALGSSRGRAGLRVAAEPLKEKLGLAGPGESFFRVEAGELVLQKIAVPAAGRYRLGSQAQGVGLACRLEDADGWPLLGVPASCQLERELEAGELRWLQLPLTVESMRRTYLEPVEPPVVLSGDKPHGVRLNQEYTCALGPDGRDEFHFELPAELELGVRLTHGMQARLLRLRPGQPEELVELLPPQERPPVVDEDEGEGYPDGDGEGEGEHEDEDEDEDRGRFRAPARPSWSPPPVGGPAPLQGQRLTLAAGRYLLRTEHARGDVGIQYRLGLATAALAPGLSLQMPVPGRVQVRVPERGVVKLATAGEVDVRCRLFDARGRLVAEGSEVAADWNCLVAVPLEAGEYQLVLEAENGRPGSTRVTLERLPIKPVARLEPGQTLRAEGQVLEVPLPPPAGGGLWEVGFHSRLAFSCSLEDAAGRELARHLDVLACGFLLSARGQAHRVRLWNRRWTADIQAKLAERPIEDTRGKLVRGRAGRVRIPSSGLYRTADKVWCLPEDRAGPLEFCGPLASLEAGPVLFSTTGPDQAPGLALEEQVARLGERLEERVSLQDRARPRLERQRSERPALHLVHLEVAPGEPWPPGCRLSGGVARGEGQACFAATGPVQESLLGLWLASPKPRPARLARRAVPAEAPAQELLPGARRLWWSGPAARYRLPSAGFRLALSLPPDGWAVLADAGGAAVDLCPPDGRLQRCELSGQGGEVWLVSDSARQARVELTLLVRVEERAVLGSLVERWPARAGVLRAALAAAAGPRRLEVSGARQCHLALEDGRRLSGCRLEVPAGLAGELRLAHDAGPLQAVLAPEEGLARARWARGSSAAPAPALGPGTLQPLTGQGLERLLHLERPVAVHLRAESGVCALWGPAGPPWVLGAGQGCDLVRLLGPGAWRIEVRAFADRPLSGGLWWTEEPVQDLQEGVGQEEWVGPGEARLARFTVRSEGQVGLGLRAEADVLECAVRDAEGRLLGEGCQQFLRLAAGAYLLEVRTRDPDRPARFRPVLLGLAGARSEVPEAYLQDFFRRIGAGNAGGER
jgi:hypothetical protein